MVGERWGYGAGAGPLKCAILAQFRGSRSFIQAPRIQAPRSRAANCSPQEAACWA